MHKYQSTFTIACWILFASFCSIAQAQLAQPKGPVVLTVSGKITQTNQGNTAVFDLDMLENLQQRTTRTSTPWHTGVVDFKGPLGTALLKAVGAQGTQLVVAALNDYKSKVPVGDLSKYDVIFATHIDGKPISLRNKGPLFLIYPFDEQPALKSELYFNRSVWQIKSVVVE